MIYQNNTPRAPTECLTFATLPLAAGFFADATTLLPAFLDGAYELMVTGIEQCEALTRLEDLTIFSSQGKCKMEFSAIQWYMFEKELVKAGNLKAQ
jgi:hypothetical protein